MQSFLNYQETNNQPQIIIQSFETFSVIKTESSQFNAKRPIKRQNKVSIFLAYVIYFSYLYTYERASYGHIKSAARHDSRDEVDA